MFPEFTDAVAPDSPLLQNLNPEQLAAVTLPATHALILAGAGSGKTRVLTTRIAWLLQTGQVSPGGILAVTFTNKAAKEMLLRVHELTGVEPGRFWGGTFHGIGHRALRMHGEAIGLPRTFTILDAEESEGILRDAVDATERGFFKDKTHPKPGPLHSILSMARNTQLSLADVVNRFHPQHEGII
eukprot:gene11207-13710_t